MVAAVLDKEPTTALVEAHVCLSARRRQDSVYSPRETQLEAVAGWKLYIASTEEVREQIRAAEGGWMDMYGIRVHSPILW